jgi:hypothetical protein
LYIYGNRGRESAREKDPINTPRHSTYREVSSSGKRSSARKYGNDDDEDEYIRGQIEEGNRSPSKPVRIVGERIRYSEVELKGTDPEDFRSFIKQLIIFERECQVAWDRSLIHKDVTGFLDLR